MNLSKRVTKQQGITLVESIISMAILLFLLFAFFLIFNSTILSTSTLNKRVDMVSALDQRIDDYALTGNFDNTSSGSMVFSQEATDDPTTVKFTVTGSGITVSKDRAIFNS
jgi:type II secretory pathway pseudopilin PulG